MRELYVVPVAPGDGMLTLATTPGGTPEFRLRLDERTRAAIVAAVHGGGVPADDIGSPGSRQARPLSPREIQARLRAGASLDEVTAASGLPRERVEAYAAPVLSERELILRDALQAAMSRPHHGLSTRPLGDAVRLRLPALSGAAPETATWSARRADRGAWVVTLRFTLRGRSRTANWRWDRTARSLAPLDTNAAELGHIEAGWTPEAASAGVAAVAGAPADADPAGAGAEHAARPAPRAPGSDAPSAGWSGRQAEEAREARAADFGDLEGGGAAVPDAAATRAGGGGGAGAGGGGGAGASGLGGADDAAQLADAAVPVIGSRGGSPARGRSARGSRAAVPTWADVLLGVGQRHGDADEPTEGTPSTARGPAGREADGADPAADGSSGPPAGGETRPRAQPG